MEREREIVEATGMSTVLGRSGTARNRFSRRINS
jgi:hypothetical protein